MLLPRRDMRQPNELRAFSAEFGISGESQGSVKLLQGMTCVAVSVYGPHQPKYTRQEEFDQATLEIDIRYGGTGNAEERNQIENKVSDALYSVFRTALKLRKFPRKLIALKVCIIRDDGALISTCVNACSLAILDSGIPVCFIPLSVSCILSPQRLQFFVDPCGEEEDMCTSSFSFTMECSLSPSEGTPQTPPRVVHTLCGGEIRIASLTEALQHCTSAHSIVLRDILGAVAERLHTKMQYNAASVS